MNNLNIPLYRAEKIESDKYVEGFLIKKNYNNQKVRYFILEDKNTEVAMTYEIDPTTLSINFPDILDSEVNKTFASLSEDGKGGDICEINISDAFLEKNYNIKCPLLMTRKGIVPKEYIGFANFKIINVIGLEK